jgi:hypothetical protein
MPLSLLYFAVRRLLRALTLGSDRDGAARDIEILVLRHQLRVLSRGRRGPAPFPGCPERITVCRATVP